MNIAKCWRGLEKMGLTRGDRGGFRENSGRSKSITLDDLPRKNCSAYASPAEWKLILEFIHIVKDDPQRAIRILKTE